MVPRYLSFKMVGYGIWIRGQRPGEKVEPKKSYLWAAWLGTACALFSVAGALSSGLGYRLGFWHYTVGFKILVWATGFAALAAVLSLIAVLLNLGQGRLRMGIAGVGVIIGLVTAFVPLQWKLASDRLPKIHDITTDTDDPPAFVAASRLRKSSDHPLSYAAAEVVFKQKAAYPDIRPLYTRAGKQQTFLAARRVLEKMNLEVVRNVPGENPPVDATLEAVDTSLLFGFKDDLVVRIREQSHGCRVDARSMSRVGKSDLGQNAKRIRLFFKALRNTLAV